jgi:hypothetical protein
VSSSTAEVWSAIALGARNESPLWAGALRADGDRVEEPVFSPLGEERFALSVETIYEGYLAHYGRPRLFSPPDRNTALLLGDYLYAQGLVHLAATGSVEAVAEMAELISLCAHLRAEANPGDGDAWASTVAGLGDGGSQDPSAVSRALATHHALVG